MPTAEHALLETNEPFLPQDSLREVTNLVSETPVAQPSGNTIKTCSETAPKTSPREISDDHAPGLATMNGPGAVTKSDGEADKPVGAVSSSSTEASLTVLAREGSNETREAADWLSWESG